MLPRDKIIRKVRVGCDKNIGIVIVTPVGMISIKKKHFFPFFNNSVTV